MIRPPPSLLAFGRVDTGPAKCSFVNRPGQGLQNVLPVLGELVIVDPTDRAKLGQSGGHPDGDSAQCAVEEDHVRRYTQLLGRDRAPDAKSRQPVHRSFRQLLHSLVVLSGEIRFSSDSSLTGTALPFQKVAGRAEGREGNGRRGHIPLTTTQARELSNSPVVHGSARSR